MTTSRQTEASFVSAPADLVADLAGTLDVMVDQPLAGVALFGEELPAVDRYTIERRLGAGATAVVYAARDTTLDRPVALKIVARRDAGGAWRARAHREARALARLSHRNVVAVHDLGEWRGHPFIAMELVVGGTLARWQAEAPRAWPAILRHYLAAGRGLEAAHSVGLVHRDFKPANVLVADSGRVVVTDFGLATLAEPAAGRLAAGTGARIGTPAYLAPEQGEGAPPQPSADVYSFSVALCEALVGQHPSLGPFDWRRVPARARAAIERGMAADPAQRWPSLGPLLAAIEATLAAPRARRRRAAGVALALALVAGVVGLAHRRASLDGTRATVRGGDPAGPAPAPRPGERDASPHVALARGLLPDDPTAAAALLRETPASQRGDDWITAARATLLRPLARELRCLDGPPRSTPSVAHGLVAAVGAGGHAIVCDLAADRVAPLTGGAVCARVLDRDHVAVLTVGDELAVFARAAGWRPRGRFPLGPPAPRAPAGGSRCEHDVAIAGLRAFALRRGGAWELVDLDAPPAARVVAAADVARKIVAVARDRRRALVRDARGDLLIRPDAEPLVARAIAAHDPHSGIAVAIGSDGDGAVIDVERGAVRRRDRVTLHVHPQVLEIAPGGRMAVAANYRGTLLWWPLDGGARAPWPESIGEKSITQLVFNRAGTRLVWRNAFGGIGVRDVGRASGHELPVGGRAMCHVTFATDDRVAAVSCDGRVLAWDLAEERAFLAGRHELAHCQPDCGRSSPAIWSAAVHPGGAVLATAGRDGTVGVWPLGRGPAGPPATRLSIGRGIRSFTTLFVGDRLLVASHAPVAQIWSWRTGAHLVDLPGHEVWAYALAVARPAGSTVFVTGSKGGEGGIRNGSLRFWSEDGSLLATRVVGATVNDLVTSPSGRLVAAGLMSGDVLISEVPSGAPIARVTAHRGWARRVAFLDEATVISAGDDGVVQRIELPSGAITTTPAHHGEIYDLDRHGHRLLTASRDGTIRLWDLRDGSLVRTYIGHKQPVLVVRWHPDGERFVSGDGDALLGGGGGGHACVWRIDRDTCHDWLIGHRDDVRAAQFIDEARVMTASFDGTVRIWTPIPAAATAKELAAELERRAPPCLDAQQRVAYLGEPGPEAAARARVCRGPAP